MSKYKVGCFWQVGGYIIVEAGSKDEAIEVATSSTFDLPDNTLYVEGSFDIDPDSVIEIGEEDAT